ncbi:MAG: CPBP family intramembrane metalloprotease [Propionibacteriaceae bacterium]|nr:CPBP family intramembrane metalloprotease [Propionibacteriaceae bacterium]
MLETVAVLGISLGASAIWAVLSIVNSLTMGPPLNQQETTINQAVAADRPWLDLLYQLANIAIPLVPVLVAFYLLANVRRPDGAPFRIMGIKWANAPRDAALGVALAAVIGIPGLGLYAIARAVGMNLNVVPTNLSAYWWTVPVLILLAAMNGILEETVMVGYLFTRWTQLAWGPWKVIVTSALIRGTYHLYQGFGGFIGNAIMGAVFGWVYMRTKRVLPLVIAHTILDIVSFVGYSLLKDVWPWL